MVRLGYVIYYVKDVPSTVTFFEKAFGVEKAYMDDQGIYAQLKTGDTSLAFAKEAWIQGELPGGFTPLDPQKCIASEIVFCFDDVTGAFDRALNAGCTKVADLVEKPWGQTVGYVKTPDGLLIEIASEVIPAQAQ